MSKSAWFSPPPTAAAMLYVQYMTQAKVMEVELHIHHSTSTTTNTGSFFVHAMCKKGKQVMMEGGRTTRWFGTTTTHPTLDLLRERHEPGWRLPSADVAEFGAALLVVVEEAEE